MSLPLPHDDGNIDIITPNIKVVDQDSQENVSDLDQDLQPDRKQSASPVEGSSSSSVLSVFDNHVSNRPDALIYSWLDEKTNVVKSFTHKQLWTASRNVAYKLVTKHGIKRGDRAMIIYPLGIDFLVAFVACMRVGIIVVSVYPPNPNKLQKDVPKFEHFAVDSGVTIALTTNNYRTAIRIKPWIKWPKGINWVTTDSASTSRDTVPVGWDGWHEDEAHNSKHDVVFLQYTSGSTGNPKGIMITNDNIYHSILCQMRGVQHKVSQLLPE
eukprot:scaffold99901_cov35-Attheya_sp.AAC.2